MMNVKIIADFGDKTIQLLQDISIKELSEFVRKHNFEDYTILQPESQTIYKQSPLPHTFGDPPLTDPYTITCDMQKKNLENITATFDHPGDND